MKLIDAHQHFWTYNTKDFDWITDDMAVIRQNFLPADLETVYKENNVEGCVTVQVNQSEKENEIFLKYANENNFIKGTVAWTDLMAGDIEERLAYWHQHKKLKGFRHILQGEKDRALMLKPAFKNGISKLQQFNFTYDVLIFPDQLQYALELVQSFPSQKFVIDHLAKPYIKKGEIEQWQKDVEAFKQHENVYCKISGMVTEADRTSFSNETFNPYLDVATSTFGTKRLMYGSDWPVCLVAASYKKVLQIATEYFASFSADEKNNIFYNNAVEFYNL
ncbi:amidohydrolase family protein [Parafilimonas terrae]|uniref:L-fuconolactonase n=1 Tax=Parafilimonas terrae TaxID=1465490 RepID=A0A1I5XTM3_9BACT|nr:amidohydrolase family protein [Parafilimonas terrae]SFQ35288.1 L-fuconolactonase [Parafilimonas terrae]